MLHGSADMVVGPWSHWDMSNRLVHSRMVGKLATMLRRKGWRVIKEQRIPTTDGLRNLYLVCSRDGQAIILDGQVCLDAGIAMPDEAHS